MNFVLHNGHLQYPLGTGSRRAAAARRILAGQAGEGVELGLSPQQIAQ